MTDKITIKVEADTATAQRSLSALEQKIKSVETSWSEARDAYGLFKEIAGDLYGAASGLAQFAAEQERQEASARRLGAAYATVQAATNGVVTAQQALQLQQSIVQSGVQVSAQQMGVLTRAAREYATATGIEVTQALDKMTNAIVNNSEDALTEFGIASTRATTSAQTLSNAVAALEQRQRSAGPAARTLAEDLSRAGAGLQELGAQALRAATGGLDALLQRLTGISASGGLRTLLGELGDAGDVRRGNERGATQTYEQWRLNDRRQAILRRARLEGVSIAQYGDLRGLNDAQLSTLERGLPRESFGLGQAQSGPLQLGGGGLRLLEDHSALERQLARSVNAIKVEADQREVEALVSRNADLAAKEAAGKLGRVASAAGSAADALDKAREAAAADYELSKRSLSFLGVRATLAESLGLSGSGDSTALMDEITTTVDRPGLEARARDERRRARDQGTRRGAREQSFGGRLGAGLGFGTDEEGRIKQLDVMQGGVELAKGAVDQLAQSFGGLYDAIGSGKGAGEVFQAFVADLLGGLGKMAFNKGLFYTFEGIASLFSNPAASPLYFAAGAGLLALGAGLGAAGAAARPAAPSSAGSSAPQSAGRDLAPRSAGGGSERAAPLTVVMSSLVPAGVSDVSRLREANRQGARVLRPDTNTLPRRVEY